MACLVCNAMLGRLGKAELAGWRTPRKASDLWYTRLHVCSPTNLLSDLLFSSPLVVRGGDMLLYTFVLQVVHDYSCHQPKVTHDYSAGLGSSK